MRLIVTRPEPEASQTARALVRLGHAAILSPMLDIVFEPGAEVPEREYQAVLATSANAVRALAGRAKSPVRMDTPLLAVGDRSALEAKRAGFVAARSAGGSVADLLALARAGLSPKRGPLLYAAGEDRTGDLAGQLAGLGFEVETAILYRARARPRLAGVAEAALRDGTADGVLFYSRRSAAAFSHALRAAGLAPLPASVSCFCISAAAAADLPGVAAGPVLVAQQPDQLSLFALIEREAAMRPLTDGGNAGP